MSENKNSIEIKGILKTILEELKIIRNKVVSNNNIQTENIEKRELSDYDKIILKNLESRISILEEETQKYEIN